MVTQKQTETTEAGRALERVNAERGVFDGATAAPTTPVTDSGDPIERWGRRIGRTLGWAAAIFLLWQFVRSMS